MVYCPYRFIIIPNLNSYSRWYHLQGKQNAENLPLRGCRYNAQYLQRLADVKVDLMKHSHKYFQFQ